MAKDGKMNLPSVDGVKPMDPPSADFADIKKEVDRKIMESHGVPASVVEGYVPRRVDVKMTRAQAIILRDKLRHLQDTGAKTADGRFVSNRTQAVQWLIENCLQIDR